MKLELKKDRNINGDVFYAVYQDGVRIKGIYAGNDITDADFQNKDRIGEAAGLKLYNHILTDGSTGAFSEIIKSEEF